MAMIQDLEVEQFLRDCVNIEPLALNEEFIRLPADLAYWNERYAQAYKKFLASKLDVDKVRAQRQIHYREALPLEGKKVTESVVEAAVDIDEQVIRAREAHIEAEHEKTRLYGVLDAIRSKRDMIIQIGAQVRTEMQGNPQLRSELRGDRMAKEG